MRIKDICEKVQNHLYEVGIHENVYFDDTDLFEDYLEIHIHNGDWRHDHLDTRLAVLEVIQEMPEYRDWRETVTESDGSDTYSAIHRFYFQKQCQVVIPLGTF